MQKLIRKLPKRFANCELRTANSNPEVVTKIINKVGINITERDMQAVHRNGKEGRTKFSNRKDCQALPKVKRDLNN